MNIDLLKTYINYYYRYYLLCRVAYVCFIFMSSTPLGKSTDALYPPRPIAAEAYQHQNARFRIPSGYRDVWAIVLYIVQFVVFLGLSAYAYYNIATKGFLPSSSTSSTSTSSSSSSTSRNATIITAEEREQFVQPTIKFAAIYFAIAFVVMGLVCAIFVQYLKS